MAEYPHPEYEEVEIVLASDYDALLAAYEGLQRAFEKEWHSSYHRRRLAPRSLPDATARGSVPKPRIDPL
jgi:hypothetical protein